MIGSPHDLSTTSDAGAARVRSHRAHASSEALAFVGQADAAAGSLDQPHANVLFQCLDLVTDGAVRDVQRFRGLSQAMGSRGGFERAQSLHRRQPQGHAVSFIM